MYKVLCDGTLICDARIDELALINPVIELEENKAGSFTFMIPDIHPMYELIKQRKSILEVYQDEELIFCGICIEVTTDFYKQKNVYCEGELTYFNDSVQRPARYQNITVRGLLEAYINNHNTQVDDYKKFRLGIVTVMDSNDSIYCYTNMESTMECLQKDLVEDLGGFFRVRHKDGIRYLDYLADSQNTNSQVISLGDNLLDFSSNMDLADIATAVIPLGATLDESPFEGLEVKLTIADANNGCDYIYNPDAVNNYGWIYKTVEYSGVTKPDILKTKGEKYLRDEQYENMVIEATALDLHFTGQNIESFKLSDKIRIVSAPHGLDKYFRLTKMTIDLNNPENNVITLGKDSRTSLSSKAVSISDDIKKLMESEINQSTILQHAKDNATELITNAMNGFVYKTHDELFIMDTDNPKTATRVWRWNINGLGYSSKGINGPYGLAITMDGRIVADYIATGTMSADRVKGGIFEVGGTGYGKDGKIEIKNDKGTTLITLDKSGMTLAAGQKISWNNISNAPSIPSKMSDLENDENYIKDDGLTNIVTEITESTVKTTKILCDQLQGGIFVLGGSKLSEAEMIIYNKNDEEIGEWNKEGAYITSSSYIPAQYPTTWYGNKISTLSVNQSVKPNVSSSNSEYSMGVGNIVLGQYEYICRFDISKMQSSEKPAKIEVHFANITYNVQAGFGMIMFGVADDSILYNFHFNSNDLIKTGRKSGKYVIDLSLNELQYFEIREIYNAKNIDSVKITAPWIVAETSDYGTALQIEHIDIIAVNGTKILTLYNNIKSRIAGSVIDLSDNMITMDDCIMKKNGFVLYENADLSGYTESDNGEYHTESRQFYLNTSGFMHLGIYNSTSTSSANVRINKDGTFHRYSSSSRRYKDNITKNIESDLDPTKLYDIDICQFKYKKDYLSEDDERYNKNIIGFIAEDLYEKYPICCDLNDGVPESPNYNMLIAPMLKLIQEQNERLKKLEKEVLQDDEY